MVFRAMHKDRAVRFRTAATWRGRCERSRQSMPLDLRTEQVQVPKVAELVIDKKTRSRLPVAGVVATVVLLGTLAIWLAWPVNRTSIVVAPFGNQSGDSDLERYRLALTQTLILSLARMRAISRVVPL